MSDLNELLETAETIRTNVLPESNTHELIGGHLKNIINYFESKKISTENIVSTTGLSTTKVVSQYGLTKSLNDKPGKVVDKKGEVFNAVDNNSAEGVNAHAEGFGNAANGEASHVEGIGNTADGYVSHAEGKDNKASNSAAHAEGKENKASGSPSHAEGYQTEASGAASHTEGKLTKASGSYAHAEGEGTIAQNIAEHACGRYNVSGGGVTQWSVGIGTSDDDRKNAAEIRNDGSLYLIGVGGYDGTSAYGKKSVQEVLSEAGSGNFLILTAGRSPTETESWAKSVFGDYTELAENHPVYKEISSNNKDLLVVKHGNPYMVMGVTRTQFIRDEMPGDRTGRVIFTLAYLEDNSYYIVEVTYTDGGNYTTKITNISNYVVNLTATPTASAEWAKSVFGDYKGTCDTHPLYMAVKAGRPIQYSLNGDTNLNIAASVNTSIISESLSISLEYISSGRYYLVVTTYKEGGNYSVNIARNIDISGINDAITSLSSIIPTVVQSTGTSTTSVMSQDAVTKAIKSNGVFYKKLSTFNTTGSNPTNKEDIKLYLEDALLPKNGMHEFYNSTYNMAMITTVFSDSEIFITLKRKFGYQDNNYDFEVVQGIHRYVGLLIAGDSAEVSFIYKVVLE